MAQAVWYLKRGRAGGPSGMSAEDLKGWLREASRETEPVKHWWKLMVRLIQKTFEDKGMLEEVTWATMDFIPKGRGEYWGIGLSKVVWKVCAAVVNCWIKKSVMLHDKIHGFRAGRGTGTSTLEAKLAQKLVGITHEPLF